MTEPYAWTMARQLGQADAWIGQPRDEAELWEALRPVHSPARMDDRRNVGAQYWRGCGGETGKRIPAADAAAECSLAGQPATGIWVVNGCDRCRPHPALLRRLPVPAGTATAEAADTETADAALAEAGWTRRGDWPPMTGFGLRGGTVRRNEAAAS